METGVDDLKIASSITNGEAANEKPQEADVFTKALLKSCTRQRKQTERGKTMRQTVSLENMRAAASEARSGWRTWVIATPNGGVMSYWNNQRYPRLA